MRRMRHILVLFLFLSLGMAGAVFSQEKKRNLLFIGQSKGYQHDSVTDAMATLYQLGRSTGSGTPISGPIARPSPRSP